MKILNKFNSILVAVMVLGMFFTLGSKSVFATESDIASGIYELENDVYHQSETGMAMSRSYLVPTMIAEVRKEGISYTISFSGSEYMEDYRMKVNGELVPVEIVEENTEEGIVSIKIAVDKVDADMDALMYVAPMGRDVEFKVIPKMETLTLVEAIEEEVIEEEVVQESSKEIALENEEEVVSETATSTNKTMIIVGVVVAIVAVIVGSLAVIKAKKK